MSVRKLTEIFKEKQRTFSFEFFPPKTDKGRESLFKTADELMKFNPDFFNVTYGAGGSTSKATLEIVEQMQNKYNIPVMHHFTCVKHSYEDIRNAIEAMKKAGVRNVLALLGDPPADDPNYKAGPNEPKFGYELVKMLKESGEQFCIGVPGFPEKHLHTPTKELDSQYLKYKQDCGAEVAFTQIFFENAVYYEFVERVRKAGVTMRLIPGILTITDYNRFLDFCARCGATVPQSVKDFFAPTAGDVEVTAKKGIEFAIKQCQDLLDNGAPGLHLYCLNKVEPAATVYKALRK